MNRLNFFALILCAISTAWGDRTVPAVPDTTDYQFDPTEVTATRSLRASYDLPLATSVATDFQRGRPGLSLDESLRQVPGLFIANRHNLSQGDRLSLRGLGARAAFGVRGLKILLDGIPLTMPDGQSQLNNLDLGSTGRIEILRGPSSSLYGNASGGVLSIHTQDPADATWRFEPQIVTGSYGLLRLQGKVSGQTERTRYIASLYSMQSEGYREHANANTRGLNAHIDRTLAPDLELGFIFHLLDAPYLFNPSSLDRCSAEEHPQGARGFIVRQGASKKVRQAQIGLRLTYQPASDRTSTLVLYGVDRALENPIPGRIVDLDRLALGLRTEHQFKWRGFRFTTGLDLDFQHDDRREFANEGLPDGAEPDNERVFDLIERGAGLLNQREKVRSFGPFLSLERALGKSLLVTFSTRYDRYHFAIDDRLTEDGLDSGSRSLDQFSPMLGLLYRYSALSRFYAHIATAFQTPTTSELGNRPDGQGGFNPDLDPEQIVGIEAGYRHYVPQLQLDMELALYQLRIDDSLIPYQSKSEENYFRNAGQTRNRGLELSLGTVPHPDLRLLLSYTFGHYTFTNYAVETDDGLLQLAGNEVPGVPRHRFFTMLSYRHPQGLSADLEFERVGRYWANDHNGPPPSNETPQNAFLNDAYLRIDLRLGLDYRAFNTFLSVENLFATTYNGSIVPNAFGQRYFEPAPGRTLRLGIGTKLDD